MSAPPRLPRFLTLLLAVVAIGLAGYAGYRYLTRPHVDPSNGNDQTAKNPMPGPAIGSTWAAARTALAQQVNNRGVGAMEMFTFDKAASEFEQAIVLDPDWLPGCVNLAIALLNQNKPEPLSRARVLLGEVLQRDKDNPHAHYCLGLIDANDAQFEEAARHFEAVTKIDDRDWGAWYQLGNQLNKIGTDSERADQCLKKASRLNPYSPTPLYALAMKMRESAEPEAVQKLLEEFKRLSETEFDDPRISEKYTEHGSRYARVIGRLPDPARPRTGPLPLFQKDDSFKVELAKGARWATAEDFGKGPVADLRRAVRTRFGVTMVLLDYNKDDKPDLFLLGAVVENGQVRDLLLRNDGNGHFTDVTTEAGLGGSRPSLGCCVADYDNDGFPDLFISGAGVQKLFRNNGKDGFEDVTAAAEGLDKLTSVCLGCAWVDLDQDADLDLVIAKYADTVEDALAMLRGEKKDGAGLAVYLNVGEAPPVPPGEKAPGLRSRFKRAKEPAALVGGKAPTVGLAVTDLDNDHDPDLLVLADGVAPALVLNDRLGRFHRPTESIAAAQNWNGALVLDVKHRDRSDLLLIGPGKPPVLLLSQSVPGEDDVRRWFTPGVTNAPPLMQAQAVDLDLDGWTDVVGLSADHKPVFLHNDGTGRLVHLRESLGQDGDWPKDLVAIAAAGIADDCYPHLLLWSEKDGLQLRKNLGNGNRALRLAITGRRDRAMHLQSNADAIGARVSALAGDLWTGLENTTLSAGLGQSRLPVALGIGRAEQSQVVRIVWPEGLPQAEIDQPACKTVRIEESYRKGVSCPVLLVWDGKRFRYVTDFLGAGSMGELASTGETRPPRPEESVKIDPGLLVPRDGYYVLKIAEPMDEVLYLDRLRLIVLDHPADVAVYPDERFVTEGPQPSQDLLAFRRQFLPIKAHDHKGRDVTETLRHRDGKMVDEFARRTWTGFADEHWVELDFGAQLARIGRDERLFLVLAGWTDYPCPDSIYAAEQAGVAMQPPVLEELGADGKWLSLGEIGFPAGLPRVMTKEVTGKIGAKTGRLRIRTNLQIHWDQIFLAPLLETAVEDGKGFVHVRPLEVAGGTLAARGFMKEVKVNGGPLIEYDDEQTERVEVTRWQGNLTRLGDVTELLRERDDRFVLCGPGDEITVRFDARALPPLPDGWQRSFVLRTWGYCKDSSSFTALAGRVEPLPFAGMKNYPYGPEQRYPDDPTHEDYRRRYNTRPTTPRR
jgi:tetratricopeptide (TPR) repeat protein